MIALSFSPNNQAVVRVAVAIRQACHRHALDEKALDALLGSPDRLRTAIAFVFDSDSAQPRRADMRFLLERVHEILDLDEPLDAGLPSAGRQIMAGARVVVAASAFSLSIWIVIGSILAGHNEFAASTSSGFALGTLALALFILALLEAAHIGAVALSTADVSSLQDSHPRVFKLHHHINTKTKLEHYLAARQVGVVLVVFLVSELTRTAELRTLPGTELEIPSWTEPLLRIGVPGALMVLVLGQVMPQILTARRPAAMMNHLPMAAAFHFTRMIGLLGLAQPATWLAAWANKTERIPTAPRERYLANIHDVEGHGVTAVARTIHVGAAGTTSRTETAVIFHTDAHAAVDLNIASSSVAPASVKIGAEILEREQPIMLSEISDRKYPGIDGAAYGSTIAPRAGFFQTGDTLSVHTTFEIDGWLGEDLLTIDAPTKLAAFRVILDFPPAPLAYAELDVVNPSNGEATLVQRLTAKTCADGTVELAAAVYYPEQGSLLRMRWAPNVLATGRLQLQGAVG